MTREWTLTLTDADKWYNLWDLVVASFGDDWDSTFSNMPFMPNKVHELKIQNIVAGSHVFRVTNLGLTDPYAAAGFDYVGYAWDTLTSRNNSIDLKDQNLSTDTAGAKINVSVVVD
jgi:hypothetical protein